jgi:hypothetical protein
MHPERADLTRARRAQVVGVGFHGELFDPERPDTDISKVVWRTRTDTATANRSFVFLTQQPSIAALWLKDLSGWSHWLGLTSTYANGDLFKTLAFWKRAYPSLNLWLSLEPWQNPCYWNATAPAPLADLLKSKTVAGIVLGCESGHKTNEMLDGQWREQAGCIVRSCVAYKVPIFVKQIPVNGKCSRDPAEWPKELRVRQLPWPMPQETDDG